MRHLSLGMLLLAVLFLGWATGASAAPFAYITNSGSDTVSVIDTATNTVTAMVPVGIGPSGVAVNPAGTRVYVANSSSNTVSVIDTATNTVTAMVPVGIGPSGVAVNPAGTRVYVANYDSGTVSVIDTATNTVTATVPGMIWPVGVAVNPAGTRVYVANSGSIIVSVIDTATNTVTATVLVGDRPVGVAVTPDGTRVYVANFDINVSVIDTASNTVTATVPVVGGPVGVAVTPDGTRVYVTHPYGGFFGYFSNFVSVIDTATNTVTATVPVVSSPMGVAVNPAGTRVYVANSDSDTVSVIDTATNTVTATVPVGSGPTAFGQFISPLGLGWPFIESAGWAITGFGTGDCKGISGKTEGDHCGDDWYAQDWNFGSGNDDLGKVLLSATSGQVIFSGSWDGYGEEVIIQNEPFEDFALRYTHLQEVWVTEGDEVCLGSPVGVIGFTGLTGTGQNTSHLHAVFYQRINEISARQNLGGTGLFWLEQGQPVETIKSGTPATKFAAPLFFDPMRTGSGCGEGFVVAGRVTNRAGQAVTGVTLKLSGPISMETTPFVKSVGGTVGGGNYAFHGLPNGTYTVIPERRGFIFDPPSRTVTIAGGHLSGVDFIAIPQK